jgi:inorganic pyrophosphatase
MIDKIVTVKIDRPLGSAHPKHPDLIYPVNYGYVDGVIAPDGEEQDAYVIGVNVPVSSFEGRIIAIIHRKNDIEDKWVVAPQNMIFTKKEIQNLTHFQEKYFDIEIITE